MKLRKNFDFWSTSFLYFITFCLSIATYFRWFNFRFQIGPYYFTHWLSWIGSLFIALFTPTYYYLKRFRPKLLSKLIRIHMFGNLFSFMFISIHFFQQISRPPRFYPDLGTGLALYIVMLFLVATGFFHRFQILPSSIPHHNRFIHISITLTYYIIIIVHILQGLNII
jgi:hypothetical protein